MAETKDSAKESLRSVLRNPNLRRIQLAFGGSLIGDWAYGTAILVWAFQESGAKGVGLFMAARFIGAAFAGPVGADHRRPDAAPYVHDGHRPDPGRADDCHRRPDHGRRPRTCSCTPSRS